MKLKLKNVVKVFDALCAPAQIYFSISMLSVLALLIQNYGSPRTYTVGTYHVNLRHHNIFYFVFKTLYVFGWTFILNKLCKSGYSSISWFLVILPYMIMFLIIGFFLTTNLV